MAVTGVATGDAAVATAAPRGGSSELWRRLRRSPPALTGGVIIVLLVLIAVFAPLIAPFDPTALHTGVSLAGPSWEHPLGTDQLGRDVFSRVIFGARISLLIGTA